MATCLKRTVTMLLLWVSVVSFIRISGARATTGLEDTGDERDVDFLFRDLRSQQAQEPLSNDVNEAMTLLSLLISMHRHRKQADEVMQRIRPGLQDDVRVRKRQRQCFWSVVTCY